MRDWTKMPLAALLLGSVATALPAAAAQGEANPGARVAAAVPRGDAPQATKAGKPLVMLVCRETRGARRDPGVRTGELACSTRWAGL